MSTEKKIAEIEQFLSGPKNKLLWYGSGAGTFFELEISRVQPTIGFSCTVKVSGFEEALNIMKGITINVTPQHLENELNVLLLKADINRDECFFMSIIGYKDEHFSNYK